LLRELLIQHAVSFHKIESRIKDPLKLDEKISKKNYKYKDINEITDIVGIRVITYFEDEVDKIASIINSEFVVDGENSIDKRKLETDRFGYKSLHYVVSLSEGRKKLKEYKRFREFKVEIQIRSILQHAWAEIEHDIGYKGENSIPESIKRNFFRVAALLETADIEFVYIKNSLSKYEQTVTENIKLHPEEVEINGASILSFINNNNTVILLEKEISETYQKDIAEPDLDSVSIIVDKLQYLGVKSIKELQSKLEENKGLILPFLKKWTEGMKLGVLKKGLSVFYLCYIILARNNDLIFSQKYYEHFFPKGKRKGSDINDTFNEINKISS